jgi:DNA-directed RNA polymerase subunit RPC12/RpoP
MAGPLKAKVIMARCSKNKRSFGIRIEQRGRDWVRTWAFPMDERKARREGFDANTVTGSMNADDEYPGCPYCGSMGFVQCGCEKIGCSGGVRDYGDYGEYTCPWCGDEIELQHADSFDVTGGGY